MLVMPEIKNNAAAGRIDDDLPPAEIFELLANDRRQYALRYLTSSVGATPVSELADQLALCEGDHTHDRYERIATSLYHVHLPILTDAGVVEYDPVAETIEVLPAADRVVTYLDVADADR